MSKAKGVRSGKSFVEVYLDKTKLMKGLKSAKQAMASFAASIKKMGKISLAAGLSLQALGTMAAKRFADAGDAIGKMARRTSFSSEALSELAYAADLSGTSMEKLEDVIRRMQRSIYDAGRGLSTASDALGDLGLSFNDLKNLKPEEQFKLLAKRLAAIEDPTKKAGIAMSLFGRSGTSILPMLDNFEALADEAQRLGLIMDSDMTLKAEKLTDTFSRLQKVVDMVVINIGSALEPVISKTTKTVREIAADINHWVAENENAIQTIYNMVPVLIAAGAALIAISNPLGALTAATIAFGVKFGVTMDDVKGATTTAKDAIGEMMEYFQDTFSVMTEALMSGDYITAAKAFWASLQVVWIDGVEKVKQITAEIGISFLDMVSDLAGGFDIFDSLFNSIIGGIEIVRKAFNFLQETIFRVFSGILTVYEKVRGIFADFIKDSLPSGKEYAQAFKSVADELSTERRSIDMSKFDVSGSASKFADQISKAEEQRRKAAAEGNKERKKELEEQLQVLNKQIEARKKAKEAETRSDKAGDTTGAAAGAADNVLNNETMSIFSGRLFDRLGLGMTTGESATEKYMRETAANTKETAEALGA